MANSIAKAYVQVIPSADGIKGKLTSMFGKEGNQAGSSFGSSLVGKVKGIIAAAGIGKAFTDSIMSGSEMQQLKGGVEKIFNEMNTAQILADAANAYKDLNMSANQYMSAINDVGAAFSATMGDAKGYETARTGLKAISDYATGTGKSVDVLTQKYAMITRATSSYQSIADQFSGILPATSADFLAQAQAAGFLSDNYKKLTEVPVAEYQEAVSQMLEKGTAELGLAGNTAAEAATTISGSFEAMKSSITNVLGNLALGEDIRPSLDALGETVHVFFVDNLMPAVGNILTGLPEIISSGLSFAIREMKVAANNADAIVQTGIDLVVGIGTAIISAAPYLAEAGLNLVMSLGRALLSADWVTIGNNAINALRSSLDIAAGEILGTDGNIVQSVLTAIKTNLPSLLSGGVSMVVSIVNGLLSALPNVIESAGQIALSVYDTILSLAPQVWSAGVDLIGQLAQGLISNLPAVITSAISILVQLIGTVASHAPQLLEQGISLIGKLAAGLIQAIPQVIAAIPQIIQSIASSFKGWNWGEIGTNIISGIARGISSGVGAIVSAAKQAAQAALSAAKRFLGIASPSKRMRDEVGKFIPAGLAVGIEANTKPLTDAMHDLSDKTTGSFQDDLRIRNMSPVVTAPGRVYGDTHVQINVYASENQDVDELAEELMQRIQMEIAREEDSVA